MYFDSDNAGPVPDQIIEALKAANTGYQRAYGRDTIMAYPLLGQALRQTP